MSQSRRGQSKIERREFLKRSAIAAPFAAPALRAGFTQQRSGQSSPGPNFVFVLTDDQRWDSLRATGHPFARTPNLDRLVHEGVRFSNAFVTTSLCSPSRASFLTGQYAHTHGVRDNFGDIRETAWTFPRVLQQAGYETGFFGKWHMGYEKDSPRPGFDRWISFKGQGTYFDPELNIDGQRRRVEGYISDLLTDYAVEWIRKRGSRPFLVYISHKAVHDPRLPAARHQGLYKDAQYPPPESLHDDYRGKPAWQKARRKSRTGVDGGLGRGRFDSLAELVRQTQCTLASVGEGMGRVLEVLEETGRLDDTVVIFAGDNGFFFGEHGFINKRAMYEASIRIPLVVRYPKLIRGGSVVDAMVLNLDLAPSILGLAGIVPPDEMDIQGTSWVPLVTGRERQGRSAWLYEYSYEPRFAPTPTMQGVRTTRWKYVRYPNIDQGEELYDLQNDPHEMHNLAEDPSARSELDSMRTEVYRLLKETKGL